MPHTSPPSSCHSPPPGPLGGGSTSWPLWTMSGRRGGEGWPCLLGLPPETNLTAMSVRFQCHPLPFLAPCSITLEARVRLWGDRVGPAETPAFDAGSSEGRSRNPGPCRPCGNARRESGSARHPGPTRRTGPMSRRADPGHVGRGRPDAQHAGVLRVGSRGGPGGTDGERAARRLERDLQR